MPAGRRPQDLGYRPQEPCHQAPAQSKFCTGTTLGLFACALLAAAATFVILVLQSHRHHRHHGSGSGPQGLEGTYSCEAVKQLPDLWAYNPAGPEMQVKILSYNLFWWQLFDIQKSANGAPFRLIEDSNRPIPYDLLAFQECEDGPLVLRGANMLDRYTWYPGMGTKTTAICMAFLTENWEHLNNGWTTVGEDTAEQWFGVRAVQWIRIRHRRAGKTVFFMNHHGPTPVGSGGKCGGEAIANKMLSVIHANAVIGDAVVLVGDFNAVLGNPTIQGLLQQLQRVFSGTCDGGIDHIFANAGATRVVGEKNLGPGGSDHDALAVMLGL